jgi:hypothetical protein
MMCRLGGPTVVKRAGRCAAEFSLSLYSPDPNRYGDETVTTVFSHVNTSGRAYPLVHPRVYGALSPAGFANINNPGDTSSLPIITFIGPVTNPVLTRADGSGERLALNLTIGAGESVVVDCAARSVTYGGQTRRQFVTGDSRWLTINSGANRFHFTSDDYARLGSCTIAWRGAWS